jgi:hypothetical protein
MAFEASYHDNLTPFSLDMIPFIIDTSARIIITPNLTDFIELICPVQWVEVKGITSGLQVLGVSNTSYSFYNDDGKLQMLILKDCLYVPQCTSRLLCPCQITHNIGFKQDCFISGSDTSILICFGKPTTVQYNSIPNLPLLYTASGMTTFDRFCANQGIINTTPSPAISPYNLTPKQQKKL